MSNIRHIIAVCFRTRFRALEPGKPSDFGYDVYVRADDFPAQRDAPNTGFTTLPRHDGRLLLPFYAFLPDDFESLAPGSAARSYVFKTAKAQADAWATLALVQAFPELLPHVGRLPFDFRPTGAPEGPDGDAVVLLDTEAPPLITAHGLPEIVP